MKQREFILINKGMRRDLSVSKAGESSAYENRNIRITATDRDTLLSVTNERGNRVVEGLSFAGTLVGHAVLNDYVVLFTADGDTSRIYRVEYTGDSFRSLTVFEGGLGFDAGHPIEALVDYETDDVQKVYWLDGIHVLRFMNISDSSLRRHLVSGDLYDSPVFDFAEDTTWFDSDRPSVTAPSVVITKDNGGNSRANGVAQYFLTYYNKNGQQTGIMWSSPLVYLSPDGGGGAADGSNSNRVTVTASGLDGTFDYARLYMTVRTSLDGPTVGYIVGESSVTDGTAVFVDDGSHLETADPASFIFLGGSGVVAGTMTQKDGTLFLGNLLSAGNAGTEDIASAVRKTAFYLSGDEFIYGRDWESAVVSFQYSSSKSLSDERCHIPYVTADGYYPYDSQLRYTNAQVSTFKGGEKYRFALRFVKGNGTMSKPFWVGDKVNPYYPKMRGDDFISRVLAVCEVPDEIISAAVAAGYASVQLMVAQATYSDRSVKAQGIVSPTVFNLFRRTSGLNYAQSSWIYRMRGGECPSLHLETLVRSDNPHSEMQCSWWPDSSATPSALYYTDDSGKFVTSPYGYTEFTALRITVEIEAHKDGRMAWVRFYARYYRNIDDTDAAKTYDFMLTPKSSWGWHQMKDKIVANWLSAYESADVPAEYRASAGLMYSKLDEAMDKATMYKPYTLIYTNPDGDGKILLDFTTRDASNLYAKLNREYYFVDESVVTLNSPEISYDAVSLDRNGGLKFRIVGAARMTANISDFSVDVTDGEYPSGPKMPCLMSNVNVTDGCDGLSAWPLIAEYGYRKTDDGKYEQVYAPYAYMAYMWHKTGSVPAYETDGTSWSKLSGKMTANLRYSHWTVYNDYRNGSWDVTPADVRQLSDFGAKLYEMRLGAGTVTYSGDVDELVTMPDNTEYPVFYSLQEAMKGQPLQIDSVKSVSDPVHLTYRSGAHAVIGLPDIDGKETILPYMWENERFTLDDSEGNGPYAPWAGESSLSGRTLMYREVDATDEQRVEDLTYGSFGPFEKLSENVSSGTVVMRARISDMDTSVVSDFNRMVSYAGKSYPGRSVYACLLYAESSTLLVDVSKARAASVSVTLRRDLISDVFTLNFSSAVKMSSVRIVLFDGSGKQVSEITEDVVGDGLDYTVKKRQSKLGNFSKIGFVVSFADTYTSSDGSILPVVPNLDRTADSDRLSAVSTAHYTQTYSDYIVVDGLYINPETNADEIRFADISSSPARFFTLGSDHRMTYSGRYSQKYKSPVQSRFALTDGRLFTDECPYLYIGELYHDFDSEAEGSPELDTRYGGISESAVEGNTFVEAGPRTLLSDSEELESYAEAVIDCGALYDYILNESTLQASDFRMPVELSGKTGVAETITLRSLNAVGISEMLPTSANKCSDLSVEQDGDGNWKSVISGMSLSRSMLIASDPSYKVLVLRNGYARRGMWKTYTNKYGVVQSTHTDRTGRYRTKRRGYSNGLPAKRLRIIGYDLLICSDVEKMKKKSCTWTSNANRIDYNNATLVSALGSQLVLPTPLNFDVTRDGRFANRSANGISELFIGLYHHEGSDWKLVSNIVQVRGRNADRTEIWEFDGSNVVQRAEKKKTSTD